jgi:hypothetical protein
MRRAILFSLATGAAGSASEGSSPLSKVVKMLENTMKDMIEERNLKEKSFEKTSCLAKKTTEKNEELIKESQASIDDMNNELSLLGSVTLTDEGRVLAAKIDDKKKEITQLVADKESMTQAHTAHMADLDAGIAALIDAESQIQGKTFLVQRQTITKALSASKLSSNQQQYLQSFLKQAPKAYESQVGAITELIVNLKQQYQKEGQGAKVAYAKNLKAQEAMITESNQALATIQAEFEAGEGEAAAKQKRSDELNTAIAAANKVISDAQIQNGEMKTMLTNATKQWQIYLDDSTEQEKAVNKAIEILSNDDARATFQTEHDNRSKEVFFLQIAQQKSSESAQANKSAAIETLRRAIADMKSELETEKDDIISSVDKCEKDSLNFLENAKQTAEQMDGFQANINALERTIESEQERQAKFTKDIADRVAEKEEALKVYEDKMKDLKQIEADLFDAQGIVRSAIQALSEYSYQSKGKSEYHDDDKTNPLDGVITMLETIKSDMDSKVKARQTEMTVATTANTKLMKEIGTPTPLADPEDQYVPQIAEPDSLIGDLEAERNASITAENDAQKSLNSDEQSLNSNRLALYGPDGKSGIFGAFNQMQPGCDYWMVNAPGRKSEIADEIAALLSADTILANQDLGMGSGDEAVLGSREAGADKQDHEFDFVK